MLSIVMREEANAAGASFKKEVELTLPVRTS